MPIGPRAVAALLLAAALATVVHPALGLFVTWALTAAVLAAAALDATQRRAAVVALAVLGALAVLTLVGAGVTFNGGVGVGAQRWEDLSYAFAFASTAAPAGAFLALLRRDAPGRLAAWGLGAIGAFLALYLPLLALDGAAPDAAIILPFVVGALLVAVALVWRAARPAAQPVG